MGRKVRPGIDPQWLPTDRDLALAWSANKTATCSCGTRHDEWDPTAGGDRDAYEPAVHYCRGHELLAEAQELVPKNPEGQPMPGFIPHLRPRTPAGDHPDE